MKALSDISLLLSTRLSRTLTFSVSSPGLVLVFASLLFDVLFLSSDLGLFLLDHVEDFGLLAFLTLLGLVLVHHDLVEGIIVDISSVVLDLLLQLGNILDVLSFFGVFGPHLVLSQSLMELFVLLLMLLFFESFDLCLLVENSSFNPGHMGVTLEHLSQEIVWPRDRNS